MKLLGGLKMFKNLTSKKNKITIIGCGRSGTNLAIKLYDSGNDVTVIDKNEKAFKRLTSSFGGITIEGDATNIEVLKYANIDKNSTVVIVTDRDNINIMIAQLIREFFKVTNVIIRLYDNELATICDTLNIKIVCPTILVSQEIEKRFLIGDMYE